eukprot:g7472.t1
MQRNVVELNAGISITVADPSEVFPYKSITLPNITFTSPLVNAPVPISELKLNFIDDDVKNIASLIQEANQFSSEWLHCPYVSVFVITEVTDEVKEALISWKTSCKSDNLKLLLVFAPMKNISLIETEATDIESTDSNKTQRSNYLTTESTDEASNDIEKNQKKNKNTEKGYETCTSNEIKIAEQQLKLLLNDNKIAFIKLMENEEQFQSLTFRRRVTSNTSTKTSSSKLNWQNIIFHIIELASIAFANRCLNYQQKIKKLEETKHSVGWNVGLYLLIKESLGLIHVQVNLITVALQLYSEINTFFNDLPRGPLFGISCSALDDENDGDKNNDVKDQTKNYEVIHLLNAHLDSSIHLRIRHGKARLLEILFYLFSRQVNLLEHIGLYEQLHLRAAHFLRQARPLYRKHVLIDSNNKLAVESIDILTVCLVVAVNKKMLRHDLFSNSGKLPYAQKLEYCQLLLLGRASCMRVAKSSLTSKISLDWSRSSADLIDPTVKIDPFNDGSESDIDDEDNSSDNRVKNKTFCSMLKSNMCRCMLNFDPNTLTMFDSSTLFLQTIKEYFLIPCYNTYKELGNKYKRHLLYIAVDLAYIYLKEKNFSSAIEYFEIIDSIYIQDSWKRYETINSTWLAYSYKQLLDGEKKLVKDADEYTNYRYKYVNVLLSLIHTDAINSCPEILPFIVPHLITELINSKKTILGGERRQRGDGLLTFKIITINKKTELEKEEEVVSSVESFASPFHRSKEIKVRFQITNKTFETISFDKIGITITGKDGNGKNVNTINILGDVIQINAPQLPRNEQAGITNESSSFIYVLTPGENLFEVSFICHQTCTIYFKQVALYIGYIMLDVKNIDVGMNASNVVDPAFSLMNYLSINILSVHLFCNTKCSFQIELNFVDGFNNDSDELDKNMDGSGNKNNTNEGEEAERSYYIEVVKYEIVNSGKLKNIIYIDGPPINDTNSVSRKCFFPIKLNKENRKFKLNFLITKCKENEKVNLHKSISVNFVYKRARVNDEEIQFYNEIVVLPIPNEWQNNTNLKDILEEEIFEFQDESMEISLAANNIISSPNMGNIDVVYDNFLSSLGTAVKFDFKKCTIVGEILTFKITLPIPDNNVKYWNDYLIKCSLTKQDEAYWMIQGNQSISLKHVYQKGVHDHEIFIQFSLIPLKIGNVTVPMFTLIMNSQHNDIDDNYNDYHRINLIPNGRRESVLVIGLGKVLVSMV